MADMDHVDGRRQAALDHADLATCPAERRKHEEQARAYAKILSVLSREQAAAARQR